MSFQARLRIIVFSVCGFLLAGPALSEEPVPLIAVKPVETAAEDVPMEELSTRSDEDMEDWRKVLFEPYLWRTAERLDCYITIERIGASKERSSVFHTLRGPFPKAESIEAWVRQLRQLKGLVVVRDAKHPRVIHLIEEALTKIEDYPLDRKVSGSFTGVLIELPDYLGRATVPIESNTGITESGMWIGGDFETKLKRYVFVLKPAREVLTEAVPLEGYYRLIWDAVTRQDKEGRPQAGVKFYGPRSSYGDSLPYGDNEPLEEEGME